jgi:integral membrane sensor domain MASE1
MKKIRNNVVIWISTVSGALFGFNYAKAQEEGPTPMNINVGILRAPGQANPSEIGNVGVYIVRVVNFLALTIGSFAFLAIVIGGILLLTAAGQEQQIQKGKDIIKFAVIGLIVALMAYFIVAFVQSIFYEYTPPQ